MTKELMMLENIENYLIIATMLTYSSILIWLFLQIHSEGHLGKNHRV